MLIDKAHLKKMQDSPAENITFNRKIRSLNLSKR